MGKNKSGKTLLKSTLKFFNSKLTDINDKRLQLNRSKGLAKYLTNSQKNIRDLAPLDMSMGVMSFSLYILRFSTNLGLLIHFNLSQSSKKNPKKSRNLCLSLVNDSLWCTVNLSQFFWLSFKNSTSAGLRGMQLEMLAQFIDLLVIIIRYKQEKEEYDLKYHQATDLARIRLAIEWQNKELNVVRAALTTLSIAIVFGLFSFSLMAVAISPIVSAISLMSSLARLLMNIEKDRKLLHLLKLNKTPQEVRNEKLAMSKSRLQDLNQIILNNVFLPLGLFLLITTPIPLTIIACMSLLAIHCLVNQLIAINYSDNSVSSPLQLQPS